MTSLPAIRGFLLFLAGVFGMTDALTYAIASAAALEDWDAVRKLQGLIDDPGAVSTITGVPVRQFVQWRAGTSPSTGETGFISEGGQFRKQKPQGEDDDGGELGERQSRAAQVFAGGIGDVVPDDVKSNPGVWAKIQDKALTAGATAYRLLVDAQPYVEKAMNLFFDATDDPRSDFAKIGYNPTLGTAGHTVADPIRDSIGISSHLAATIASKVLGTALYHFRKRVLGHFQGADETDWINDAATALAGIIEAVNADFGLTFKVDPAPIAAAFRKRWEGMTAGKMATTTPAVTIKPVTKVIGTGIKAKPATDEVALAGQDGKELARLLGQSKAFGVKTVADIVSGAVKRYRGNGPLLTRPEEMKLSEALAAVNSTADLLGRTRVREQADRATVWKGHHAPADIPFAAFADSLPGVMATPEAALDYFLSLRPELGVDPKRYAGQQRRQAFTLAASTNQLLTEKIQKIIGESLRSNEGVADAQNKIRKALGAIGVSPNNPQYSEMLFRTNAMDSYQTGLYEEGSHPDVADTFPVWRYVIVDDERTGEDHRPKGGKYFPQSAAFADVRGDRPYNCRCSMQWCDAFEWEALKARGEHVESNW